MRRHKKIFNASEVVAITPLTKLRLFVAKFVLWLGMIGPGVALAFDPTYWTTTLVLETTLHFTVSMVVFVAALLVIASFASFFEKIEDFAYAYGGVFFTIIFIATVLAAFQHVLIGALFLSTPILIWAYAEAAVVSAHKRETKIEGLSPDEEK